MKTRTTIVFLSIVAILSSTASVSAFTLLEDRIRFDGYIRTQFGMWLQDQAPYGMGANDINMMRGTLQLETELKITREAQLYCVFRGVKETSYDAERGVPDGFYDETDVRELFLDIDFGSNFHLRFGRQQVVWGEADYQQILDIVNPVDMSWHFMLEPWEDLRIPLYMVRAFYRIPSFLKSSFEVIWVPGWDEREDRVNKLPPSFPPGTAGRWSPHPSNISMDVGLPIKQNVNYTYPRRTLEDSNVGLRWEFAVGDFQFALMDYYTFVYSPIPSLRFPNLDAAGISNLLSNGITIDMEYPRFNMTGTSSTYYWDLIGTVIRFDLAYYLDYPYSASKVDELTLLDSIPVTMINYFGMQKSDTIKYMIGLDRPTMIRWLNKYSSFMFMTQFIQTIILDHSDNMVLTGYSAPIDKVQTMINFAGTTSYWHGRLDLVLGGAYDVTGAWLLQSAATIKPRDDVRVSLKMNNFWAHSDYDAFGLWRDKDEVLLEALYQF